MKYLINNLLLLSAFYISYGSYYKIFYLLLTLLSFYLYLRNFKDSKYFLANVFFLFLADIIKNDIIPISSLTFAIFYLAQQTHSQPPRIQTKKLDIMEYCVLLGINAALRILYLAIKYLYAR